MKKFDDFNFEAASWTLTAHEARPGHELQFASLIEQGVSQARGLFAFNSTNVEGWGLYSEWLIEPFEPAEGRLICLQHRLMRAARAFLDIELQTGKITREQALAVLKNDVMLSDPMANQEVERYTFWAPGQANAYFYGYTRLRELRTEVESALGARFNAASLPRLHPHPGHAPPRPPPQGRARARAGREAEDDGELERFTIGLAHVTGAVDPTRAGNADLLIGRSRLMPGQEHGRSLGMPIGRSAFPGVQRRIVNSV